MTKEKELIILGLMSGTSVDGLDGALVKFYKNPFKMELLDYISIDYSQEERDYILYSMDPARKLEDLCVIHKKLGVLFGEKANKIIEKMNYDYRKIDYISSHGQTLFHCPEEGASLQMGELAEIAAITGIDTIGDFRPSDLAYGGQGAPLVPFVDGIIYRGQENRLLLNLGGIANMTYVPEKGEVFAFDSGPANVWMNEACLYYSDGRVSFDKDGRWALKGQVCEKMLDELFKWDEYLEIKPPKSTGREYYTRETLHVYLKRYKLDKYDALATLTEYSLRTVLMAIEDYVLKNHRVDRMLVSGGGVHNPYIMEGFKRQLDFPVEEVENADGKEAMAFALLGYNFINRLTNNEPRATGADRKVVMGKLALTSGRRG